MNLKDQILVALGLDKNEEVSNEETNLSFQAKLVDGTIIVSEDDVLAEGSLVNVLTEDGTTMPLPVGEYRTEDGLGFVISEEGVVDSMLEEEAKKEEEEEEYDEELAEETNEETTEEVTEEVAELEEEASEEVLEEEVLEEVTEEVAPEVAPSPKTITTTTTEKVEFNKDEFLAEINDSIVALKSEIEDLKAENTELKSQLEDSAAAPLNTNKFSQESKPLTARELANMTRQERFLYNLTK